MAISAPPRTLQKLLCEDDQGPQSIDALVLSFPYEGTVSYGRGTAKGPATILKTLEEQVELYDTELQTCPCEHAGLFQAPLPLLTGSPEEVHEAIVNMTEQYAQEYPQAFFLGLGGEHSVTYPFVKGLLSTGKLPKDVGILQIDAHTDLRDTWEESKFSHACVMRRLRDDLQLETVHVGIRAVGPEEIPYIKENNVPVFYAPFEESQIPHILDALPENIFITFDVDGLDPSIMPATGTPVIGGLQWYETLKLLREVFEKKNVIGMDIVELAPNEGQSFANDVVANLLYKAIAYKFCL